MSLKIALEPGWLQSAFWMTPVEVAFSARTRDGLRGNQQAG